MNGPLVVLACLAALAASESEHVRAGEAPVAGTAKIPEPLLLLTRENLGELRAAYNASAGPRLIVFFSSGCAACDTGSAALQSMLDKLPGAMAVLAVWEPIYASDPLPTSEMLDNLTDPRVRQLWDPGHILSDELRAAELAHPGSIVQARLRMNKDPDGILYDTAVIFPAGSRWEATLPAPVYLDGGLAARLKEIRVKLTELIGSSG